MDIEELLPQEPEQDKTETTKSPLISLEKDLELYAESIREISGEIMMEGLSTNPIFLAHQHVVNIGEIILDRTELNTDWTIQASTVEEFVEKGIITPEKKALFLKNYKKPEEYMCLFVVTPEGANFVFYPYKKGNR
ncbi:hypothetical protein [Pedobacter sp. JCM 36344]|uniref:hypothetical protein n=1 Tax=Pedobacter sp. JCM 36344 TaxID=3374280 RepID=UPI00397AD182